MPAEETPIEEGFTLKFTEQGGKFIYCENREESVKVFKNILAENQWIDCEMLCLHSKLQEQYLRPSITPTKTNLNARFFLTDCEFLVAHDGSIIMCAKQIANHKLIDLPENFVIIAGTKQLTDTLSEGLKVLSINTKKIFLSILHQ